MNTVIKESQSIANFCERSDVTNEDLEFTMERFMNKYMQIAVPPREIVSETAEIINLRPLDFSDVNMESDDVEND